MNLKSAHTFFKHSCYMLPLAVFRLVMLSNDPPFRTAFVEEKLSGYAGRSFSLFGSWDSGGHWLQSISYMPLASWLSGVSLEIFGLSVESFRLPFVLAPLIGGWIMIHLCHTRYGVGGAVLALFIYFFSPFLSSLSMVGLNESLYLLLLPAILWALQSSNGLSTRAILGLGLLGGMCLLVKIDALPIVATLGAVLIANRQGAKISAIKTTTFFIGGIATALGCTLLFLWIFSSLESLTAFYGDLVVINKKFSSSTGAQGVYGALIALIANIHLYFQSLTALLLFSCAIVLFAPKKDRVTQFALISFWMIILSICFSPLIYYKRFIPLVPLACLLIPEGLRLGKSLWHKGRVPARLKFVSIATLATLISAYTILLSFNGHWRIKSTDLQDVAPAKALISTANSFAPFAITGSAPLALVLPFLTQTFETIRYYSKYPYRRDAKKLASVISTHLDPNGVVLAEGDAFRFFAYSYYGPVEWYDDNDLKFPQALIEEFQRGQFNQIIVTDSYRNFLELIGNINHNYQMTAQWEYQQPEYTFETTDSRRVPNNIFLFEKMEE